MTDTRQLLSLKALFLARLEEEQKLRRQRTTDEWIFKERYVMLRLVNDERLRSNRPLITEREIKTIEDISTGADYSSKLALRCAELALKG